MLSITIVELLVMIVILPLIGAVIGYVVAGDRMRGASGGKTPAELQAELDSYQQGVSSHFQETAELLQQMTAQYRSIYTHMAHGAAELCGEGDSNAGLAELKRLSQALDDAAAVPGEVSSAVPAAPGGDGAKTPAPSAPGRPAA